MLKGRLVEGTDDPEVKTLGFHRRGGRGFIPYPLGTKAPHATVTRPKCKKQKKRWISGVSGVPKVKSKYFWNYRAVELKPSFVT